MTIERRTLVDQIEITPENTVQVRLALQLVEGEVVISSRWHRTSIPTGVAVELQIAAVNEHLALMGEAAVAQDATDRIKAFHDVAAEQAAQE